MLSRSRVQKFALRKNPYPLLWVGGWDLSMAVEDSPEETEGAEGSFAENEPSTYIVR